jgi:hypothetical protein
MSEEQKRRRKELRSECRELEEKGAHRLHPTINYISKRDETLLKLAKSSAPATTTTTTRITRSLMASTGLSRSNAEAAAVIATSQPKSGLRGRTTASCTMTTSHANFNGTSPPGPARSVNNTGTRTSSRTTATATATSTATAAPKPRGSAFGDHVIVAGSGSGRRRPGHQDHDHGSASASDDGVSGTTSKSNNNEKPDSLLKFEAMYRRKPTEYDSDALSQDDLTSSSIVDDDGESVGDDLESDAESDADEVEDRAAPQLAQDGRPQILQVSSSSSSSSAAQLDTEAEGPLRVLPRTDSMDIDSFVVHNAHVDCLQNLGLVLQLATRRPQTRVDHPWNICVCHGMLTITCLTPDGYNLNSFTDEFCYKISVQHKAVAPPPPNELQDTTTFVSSTHRSVCTSLVGRVLHSMGVRRIQIFGHGLSITVGEISKYPFLTMYYGSKDLIIYDSDDSAAADDHDHDDDSDDDSPRARLRAGRTHHDSGVRIRYDCSKTFRCRGVWSAQG